MKKKIISVLFLCCTVAFSTSSCSEEETGITSTEQAKSLEESQMEELILYVRAITPVSPSIETRGWWQNLRSWFQGVGTSDACGLGWARGSGAGLGQSLIISVATSLVTATNLDVRMSWKINEEWKTYPYATREHQEMGNAHNKAIFELDKENPSLKHGTLSNDIIISKTTAKLKTMGYNDALSTLQKASLTILLRDLEAARNTSQVTSAFLKSSQNNRLEYQFIEEYINSILTLNTKEETIAFTEQIYTKIDSMSAVQKSTLKSMTSVGLSSVNLWIPIQ